ncbi:transporter substrate-binding domain-containing protein [Bifidobacterium parmae]|uniref:L-cystine-binding protein TcyK n=1 Tax=Bifidobacterium parmae TaxID=361854 RepID=A0A2N5J569_9BIFI|nr:transporter substrate-binding domain-containing protein [Bifidobacterium parmae]PLS29354.1 L-cystine-binding protein TcyK [Bifidobacterium parmae]
MAIHHSVKAIARTIAATLPVLLLVGVVSGCGQSATGAESGAANDADAKTIVVGLNTKTSKPFNYVNEDGQLDGYEYQILKRIDDLYPEYRFEYKQLDWPNTLASLDTGKIQVAASSLQLNDERKAKYGYTDQGLAQYVTRVVVNKSDNKIHKLADLAGKTVLASNGDASAALLEKYNAKHPDGKIKLKYGDWTLEQIHTSLSSDSVDAITGTELGVAEYNAANPAKPEKAVGEVLGQQNTRFFFDKSNTELKTKLDDGIKKLRDSGELKKLSKQYLNGDFSAQVDEKTLEL